MADQGSMDQEASTPMLADMMMPDDPTSIEPRSATVEGSSGHADEDRDAVPLLRLTSPIIEKAGENRAVTNGPADLPRLSPLLGTIYLPLRR